jgi:hypothetical protein
MAARKAPSPPRCSTPSPESTSCSAADCAALPPDSSTGRLETPSYSRPWAWRGAGGGHRRQARVVLPAGEQGPVLVVEDGGAAASMKQGELGAHGPKGSSDGGEEGREEPPGHGAAARHRLGRQQGSHRGHGSQLHQQGCRGTMKNTSRSLVIPCVHLLIPSRPSDGHLTRVELYT